MIFHLLSVQEAFPEWNTRGAISFLPLRIFANMIIPELLLLKFYKNPTIWERVKASEFFQLLLFSLFQLRKK